MKKQTMYIRTTTVSLVLGLILSACGSSPPVRYYALESTLDTVRQDPSDAVVLGFGPLRMPEYLNRSQLVTRGSAAELQVDEFHRWAEPLDTALMRIVSSDVDNRVDGLVVFTFPYESVVRGEVDYRLVGDINRFDSDQSGRVVLEVQWGVTKVEGKAMVVPSRRVRYEARASMADDPGAKVTAMNQTLADFSRDIADELEAMLKSEGHN